MTTPPEAFLFRSQQSLVLTTGLKAADLAGLRDYLKIVPESSIFFHTHHFLQQHQSMTPEPPNDFAFWVTNVLQEDEVGERLTAIDTIRFQSLEALRLAILEVLDSHLNENPQIRRAPKGEEFYFMKCLLFVLPTAFVASDLAGFLNGLKTVSISSLYNHIFIGRMRPPYGINDFSYWLRTCLGENALATKIEKLDPYTHTMEGLRKKIIHLVEKSLEEKTHDNS